MEKELSVIFYAALGKGLSGGDNILIELCRRWADKSNITIYTGKEGHLACEKKQLDNVKFELCPNRLPFKYLERMFWALKTAFTFDKEGIVYTSSDFPHDLLVGLIIKLRKPSIKWVAGYYLVAPHPLSPSTPYRKLQFFRGLGYWLMQRITLRLVNRYADKVCVTSEPEREHFTKPTILVRGGVDIHALTEEKKLFDVVFMGRLHYQKGIKELSKIWLLVKKDFPKARLVVIGDGPLRKYVPTDAIWIKFADEELKELIFRHSKVFVHTSTFDSGGMSAAEAMGYGVPAVGFNLLTFKTYYPRGMLKARTIEDFADQIYNLLKYDSLQEFISQEAYRFVSDNWDWDKRAVQLWKEFQ